MSNEIKKCRLCNSKELVLILNLKDQPPANSIHSNIKKPKKFPLKILFCKNCSTAQLSMSLSPNNLFSKYFWVTGTSSTAKKHSFLFYRKLSKFLGKNGRIFEIASNDGTFLRPFIKNKHTVIGIDPARNIAKLANLQGIKTINDFFSIKSSKKIKKKFGTFDLIFARNVIPHVKNIKSVIKGISNISDNKSIIAVEFHYSKDILKDLQYDSIYHEHIFYFSIKTLTNLFSRYGLYSFDVFSSPISGGSLVLLFSKKEKNKSLKLNKYEEEENILKINSLEMWKKFGIKSVKHKKEFRDSVIKLYRQKGNLFGYGASARSSTLLNYCNLSSKYIEFIIDKNSLKHNFYTPGTNIPILPLKGNLSKIKKKNMILLAWNFKHEIIQIMKKIKYQNKILIPFKKNDN